MPRKPATKKTARKRPSATLKSENKPISKLVYLTVFVIVTSFIAFLYFLDSNTPSKNQKTKKSSSPKASVKKEQRKPKKPAPSKQRNKVNASPKPLKYEFYGVLPNVEIEVPKDYTYQNKKIPPAKVKPKQQKLTNSKNEALVIVDKTKQSSQKKAQSKLYQLQISAFQTHAKAEALKAQLGFMGVQSNISTRLLKNKKKLYRVRIGPSKDKKALDSFKKLLEKQNFKPILQKVR